MAFELPALPYDYEALQPYMSAETLHYHHDKHHKAYVDNLNKLLPGSGFEGMGLEEIVKASFGKNAGVFNNAAQDFNHIQFWPWMKKDGGGKKVPGSVLALIDRDLGGFDKFRNDFIEAGKTQFGSGWCWLAPQERQARDHQDAERREPAGSRRLAAARLRCVGALLLHRLSQRAAQISRGVVRPPHQLGSRRGNVRARAEIAGNSIRIRTQSGPDASAQSVGRVA